MIQARLQQFSNVSDNSLQSSDNSTDSSEGSGHYDGPNIEAERGLPSVVRLGHVILFQLLISCVLY